MSFTRYAAVACVALVCGCGGGGDGSGEAPDVSPSTLTFTAGRQGPLPEAKAFAVTFSSSSVARIIAGVPKGAEVPSWLRLGLDTSSYPVLVTCSITSTALPLGTYAATVRIATGDAHENLIGYADVTVSYTVTSLLTANPPQLAFQQVRGGAAPAAAEVVIADREGSSHPWTASLTSDTAGVFQLDGGRAASGATLPATLTVRAASAAAPGTYSARVHVEGAGASFDVPVTLTVSAPTLAFPSPSVSLSIDAATTAGQLSTTLPVGSTGGPLGFTVQASAPWLAVTPVSGTTGSSVTLSVVPSKLAGLPNGEQDAALVFAFASPGAGSTTVTLPVQLTLDLPSVALVAPYVAVAGGAESVILRGSGFTGVQRPSQVMFGTTPAAAVSALSDGVLRATVPSIPPGSYPVAVSNALGLPEAQGTLVVVNPLSYTATTIPYSGGAYVHALAYDAERRAILVALANSGAPGALIRIPYSEQSGTWGAPFLVSVPALEDIALTLDGKSVLELTDDALAQLDPVTLRTQRVTPSPLSGPYDDMYLLRGLGLSNDGNAVVVTGLYGSGFVGAYLYSVSEATFRSANQMYFIPTVAASADGSLVLVGQNGISPASPAATYVGTTSSFGVTPFSASVSTLAIDREARRILINSTVYDAGFNVIGELPTFAQAAAFSPDGTRLYFLDSQTSKLRTVDVTSAAAFAEVGTGVTPAGNPGPWPKMTVSPDGRTIFIAGVSQVVVQPAP